MGMYVHVCSNTIVIKGLDWKSNYEIPAGSVYKVLVMFSILFQGFCYNVLATSSPSSHWHFFTLIAKFRQTTSKLLCSWCQISFIKI